MAPFRTYIICATTRSGSTLLCRLLSETKVAGNPNSYFHVPSVSAWMRALNVTDQQTASEKENLETVIEAARLAGRGGTDIFGLRLMRKSFDFLMEKLALLHPGLPSDAARFEAAFGRTGYIHLTRSDKVAQAVSLVMATQTGLWHKASDGTELERTAPPQEPTYNADEIAGHVAELKSYDGDWEQWFEQQRIDPIRVSYEELSANPGDTLRQILMRLGLDPEMAKGISPGVAKLADETSRSWVERFITEQGNG
ncbi:MAG: Stf0 family sulfotransferase [Stappiaceae bacterium]